MPSKIYLIGFGPGDPELLTIKAHRILQETQIIFYDNLLDESALAQYSAEKVYVGKRKGSHSKKQDEINHILYEASKTCHHIVRLKGGDPLIFGRVGEEIAFLQEKQISVEIIPGISSASAAAAACGISLTQRGISSSVAYCTGHPISKITIPDADTLVFFMGASSVQEIVHALVEKQWSLQTPTAVIYRASSPQEQITITTLAALDKEVTVQSPSIIIVGAVVGE